MVKILKGETATQVKSWRIGAVYWQEKETEEKQQKEVNPCYT